MCPSIEGVEIPLDVMRSNVLSYAKRLAAAQDLCFPLCLSCQVLPVIHSVPSARAAKLKKHGCCFYLVWLLCVCVLISC